MNSTPSSLMARTASSEQQPTLSLPRVLHFLQTEWRRFELERNEWEIERAEMQAKINLLEGERRGLESVKSDLVKRIKMLEYALRAERVKNAKVAPAAPVPASQAKSTSPSKTPAAATDPNTTIPLLDVPSRPVTTDLNVPTLRTRSSALSLRARGAQTQQSRDLLRAFLREASALSAQLVNDVDAPPELPHAPPQRDSKAPTVEAAADGLGFGDRGPQSVTFESLPADAGPLESTRTVSPSGSLEELVERNESRSGRSTEFASMARRIRRFQSALVPSHESATTTSVRPENGVDDSEADTPASTGTPSSSLFWRPRLQLQHHLDAVRMVEFHPTDPLLASASEDGTVKLWNLPSRARRDVEPYLTLRASAAPLLSVAFDVTGEFLFSGAADALITVWKVTENRLPYSSYDKRIRLTHFDGHTDAVWDLKAHPSEPFLASCSADGTVRLWDTRLKPVPLEAIYQLPDFTAAPTSLAFLVTDPSKLMVSYRDGTLAQFDLATQQPIFTLRTHAHPIYDFGQPLIPPPPATPTYDPSQINRVVTHSVANLVATVHDDRTARFFDPVAGTCIHAMTAHTDAVAAAQFHPNGLVLVTGGHDCSMRVWDVGSRACLQEWPAHRRRRDAGIWSVRCAPDGGGGLVSAGADGVVRVYES
ncbi:hypothetical protein AMAG_12188 [Allomyces macrogynus ATCC 38327]|uniref:Striatin N-terminal domain-containing protein n=1 Tax=Allomyces macrogynus (strain ATCC 38327) TaxID=578462 RepID=A0A0L0SX32_ALLM3|nr:hypothetical protein AMAG_12188 [Allomyces macrogynus ATCC 38327]|eukprot:KNE67113.1 hypothetical protein AMAG_12188 [Allomyces macrogynus ATCC 38327]